ncbi:MAG: hypothetical protein JWP04_2387 [Belnapia sp.]|nr:hypothetical protein [Belnapia sp.]
MTADYVPLGLTRCDIEPIHAPGSIQPHGLLVLADRDSFAISHVAGDVEGRLGLAAWQGLPLTALLGEALAEQVVALGWLQDAARPDATRLELASFLGQLRTAAGELLDVSAHLAGRKVVVEFEPAAVPGMLSAHALNRLAASSGALAQAASLAGLCDSAAAEFRLLTGFDRVMIYRFLHDDAGAVVAEARGEGMHSFLHQHFPAADIPRQARALYLRNLIRVIPDVGYAPVGLRPGWTEPAPLDMSDCSLRSVSPIHLQYLVNMGVRASASVSIVIDGVLWGLIACHHATPRTIPYDTRAACCSLAGSLARQLKARKQADSDRQLIRLRNLADELVGYLSQDGPLRDPMALREPVTLLDVARLMDSDGVVILRGDDYLAQGACPPEPAVRELVAWLLGRTAEPVFGTDNLPGQYPAALGFQAVGSGLLAVTLSPERPWLILWFRSEIIETIQWAGNPHKAADGEALAAGLASDLAILNPRASFAAWQETVRAHARSWSQAELDTARRLRTALLEVQQMRNMRELNQQLTVMIQEKGVLLQQKEFLIGEVNHRVQNSLQLVSSFLSIQARASGDPALQAPLEEARRRLKAVSVLHRRLYRGEQVENVDAARYIAELCEETTAFMGQDWAAFIVHDLTPVIIPISLAVPLGLVLTELLININKHAYGGLAGPVTIRLTEQRGHLYLVVADRGKGGISGDKGFGSRIIDGLMHQLGGTLASADNQPGLRTTIAVPIRSAHPPPNGEGANGEGDSDGFDLPPG